MVASRQGLTVCEAAVRLKLGKITLDEALSGVNSRFSKCAVYPSKIYDK